MGLLYLADSPQSQIIATSCKQVRVDTKSENKITENLNFSTILRNVDVTEIVHLFGIHMILVMMWNICKIFVRYLWNICKIFARYLWDICEIFLRYLWDICEIFVRNLCDICLKILTCQASTWSWWWGRDAQSWRWTSVQSASRCRSLSMKSLLDF